MTQQQLKEHIQYDEITGSITIIKPTSNRQRIGDQLDINQRINLFGKSYGLFNVLAIYLYGNQDIKLITLDGSTDISKSNLLVVGSEIGKPMTTELLKKYLMYSTTTGEFTWKSRYCTNIEINSTAGSVVGTLPDGGYRIITLLGKTYQAHRLAWLYVNGEFPEKQLDHINHNRDDNRIDNLREASIHTNMKNKSLYKNNRTSYSGVTEHGTNWKARIGVNGNKVLLGVFSTFNEAVAARKAAEKLLLYHENHGLKV